jgi:hypothetical protein
MTVSARPKDAVPSYALGGILADAMGLGKTLTMIAVIVLTASHATKYMADSRRDIPAPVSDETPRSRATLVVATSKREWPFLPWRSHSRRGSDLTFNRGPGRLGE